MWRRVAWWCSGQGVELATPKVAARGFDSRPFRFQITTLGKLFTHTRASVTKQYNLVPVKWRRCPAAGKVTVGLASRWPCVRDFSGLCTCGLTTYEEGRWAPRLHSTRLWAWTSSSPFISHRTLAVPRTRTTLGDRSFAVAGPRVWNSLPATVRQITSYGQSRQHLKTRLFRA